MKKYLIRPFALFMATIMLLETILPLSAFALTGGPSQPETQNFMPVGTTEMVDAFTGDFSYNIPLLDVGGYPINLSYHSGITMDEEATWVGLGWNINPGSITRDMRGLPDDFNGDEVKKEFNIKENTTWGVNLSPGNEIAGVDILNLLSAGIGSVGIYNNNYKGLGLTVGISSAISLSKLGGFPGNLHLGLQLNSQEGVDIEPSIGFSPHTSSSILSILNQNTYVGLTINSRAGLRSLQTNLITNYLRSVAGLMPGYLGALASHSFGDTHLSFVNPTYFPSITLPYESESVSFHATLGGEVIVDHLNGTIDGYYSNQKLRVNSQSNPAFGYFNCEAGNNNPDALLDFNREKDGPFRESTVALAIPNGTYDLFTLNGEGLGGQFRAYRTDVGIFHDPYVYNSSTGNSFGGELGLGELIHGGVDISVNTGTSSSGPWTSDNLTPSVCTFTGISNYDNHEAYSLRNAGEWSPYEHNFYGYWGGEFPARTNIEELSKTVAISLPKFNVKLGATDTVDTTPSELHKPLRDRRTQAISFLTAKEAALFGLDKSILNYPLNVLSYNGCQSNANASEISRNNFPSQHVSEITTVNPDGRRYVFGVPAYNTLQKQVTFNVNHSDANPGSGHVGYKSIGTDAYNSIGNKIGIDHYFESTTIPQYAHSFLLTAILSPDYEDVDQNGISDNDLGEAIKFNYSLLPFSYKWRLPFAKDSAHYLEGFNSIDNDGKGNYEYGEKQIWYLHSIESKNYVAQFILEDRADAIGVKDENGGGDFDHALKRLKEIRLYSKEELVKHGSEAIPIKAVHFEYNYSLCTALPNSKNGSGKLTLKKVWFSYQDNGKGLLNSYAFNYNAYNPNYHLKKYDRWGNYQNNDTVPGMLPNRDFPYTLQDTSLANLFSSAWTLTDITLPSGARIHVKFESDDYAYVQDERAMQMFVIKGFASDKTTVTKNFLYDKDNEYNYLMVDLPENVANGEEFKRKYLEGINDLYFKCKIDIANDGRYEWVSGYCNYDEAGMVTDDSNHAYLKLKLVYAENVDHYVHPLALAAWQFLRVNIPEKAFPGSDPDGTPVGQLLDGLVGMATEFINIIAGFNSHARLSFWGKMTLNNESWIRLRNPTYKKLGGGCRVKQLTISDNWNEMSDGDATTYGQQYEYTMPFFDGKDTIVISSGVASYEPMAGGDEIPLRLPLTYDEKIKLAPNNEYYIEKPLGESLYPGATVGYRKVTVSNITPEGIERTKTGKTVHEFYTAYDFPVINDFTNINPVPQKHKPLFQIFNTSSEDFMTVSQGFTVECNDMHGKLFRTSSYDANDAVITSTEYQYFTQQGFGVNMLRNENLPVLDSKGNTGISTIGEDIDIWQDMREQATLSEEESTYFNLETFAILGIFSLPFTFPGGSFERTRFRSAATTKYVFRKGIVDKVITQENGSTVVTSNVYFDKESGQSLISATTNEFSDPVYTYNMPAHWVYNGMAGAYKNISMQVKDLQVTNGKITSPDAYTQFFFAGDEVMITDNNNQLLAKHYWLAKEGTDFYVLDEAGVPFNSADPVTIKVLQSGRKNMTDEKVGQVVSLSDPIFNNRIAFGYPNCYLKNGEKSGGGGPLPEWICYGGKVISANANEYKNKWKINCHMPLSAPSLYNGYECQNLTKNQTINPYHLGILGNWRMWKNLVNYSERTTAPAIVATDTRNDGIFRTFDWYWKFNTGLNQWERNTDTLTWIRTDENTLYNSNGTAIESKDALNLFTTAIYGYLGSQPVGVAANATYRSIAYDGFEEYDFANSCSDPCYKSHWSFIDALNGNYVNVSSIAAHSGLRSLFIKANKTAEVISPLNVIADTTLFSFSNNIYLMKEGGCLPDFAPLAGEYLISAWVKEKQNYDTATNYSKNLLKLNIDGGTNVSTVPNGPVIDGWQRYETRFTISATASALHVILKSTGADLYVDDVRIHPFNATMKCFVYHPFNLRLMATLDENNYATFYEYDDEGILVRLKKETERGIVTINENRSYTTNKL
ncbi:MAG: hypothetical protein WBB36_18570 [Chitinophagales bacterium]